MASRSRSLLQHGPAALRTPNWYVIDGKDQVVGRLACTIAKILTGKHKPVYDPSVACGDYVIVKNCHMVKFTGKKMDRKLYRWHTGYPGGLESTTPKQLMSKHVDRDGVLWKAVYGMLPRNRLRKDLMRRLKLYAKDSHPHSGMGTLLQGLPPHLLPKPKPGSDIPAEKVFTTTPGYVISFERDEAGELVRVVSEPQLGQEIPKKPAKGTGLMSRGSQPVDRSEMKPLEEIPAFKEVLDLMKEQEAAAAKGAEKKN